MLKLRIDYNLQCEVDYKKVYCKQEPAHCHITRNGVRIAKVWLNPVRIESGHSLERNEIDDVIYFVEGHKYELASEYEKNRLCGAD